MRIQDTFGGYKCDYCPDSHIMAFDKGTTLYGCEKCDYDVCTKCYGYEEIFETLMVI